MIVETQFLSSLLQYLWSTNSPPSEVLHSMRDNGGYDLVIECNSVVRFIQLKSMLSTRQVRVNARLLDREGACVVGVLVAPETLRITGYRWIGWDAREAHASKIIGGGRSFQQALSLRRNADGERVVLPCTHIISPNDFSRVGSMDELAGRLFGLSSQ